MTRSPDRGEAICLTRRKRHGAEQCPQKRDVVRIAAAQACQLDARQRHSVDDLAQEARSRRVEPPVPKVITPYPMAGRWQQLLPDRTAAKINHYVQLRRGDCLESRGR